MWVFIFGNEAWYFLTGKEITDTKDDLYLLVRVIFPLFRVFFGGVMTIVVGAA